MLQINDDFISKIKYLKLNHIKILLYLYSWMLSSNPPKLIQFEDGLFYFYIYLNKIAKDLFLTRRQVQDALFRLENKDKRIESSLQPFIFPKQVKKENKLYISLNPNMVPFILSDNLVVNELQKRIKGNSYNIIKIQNKERKMLFEDDMLPQEKNKTVRYSQEAYLIVSRLIEKSKKDNKDYFNHKYKEFNEEQTKLFNKACGFVQMIYSGNFVNPRQYPLIDSFINNEQFPINISEVKKILKEVEGDWVKVKKLIMKCYNNFSLMHDDNYCPCNKKYLTKVISEWFYGYSDEAGKYQSQFIQCLFEIPKTNKFFSEKKADNIFDKFNDKEKISANKLYDLAPKGTSAGQFFENIKKMIEWGKQVTEVEMNSKYWFGQSSELPSLFADYCKENKITVNASTVDIEKAVNCNGPWVWFVKQASQEHNMNENLCDCVTSEDLIDCYSHHSLSFDDMEDVIF